ncbi:membrane protein insertase YidC, partial [Candidatus Deferrimicrobium sp.]|uniref:membrane protein insertase YidC n=1 Tax=Candidatus Deferrimicrobium sp. TaxID=3060586 RepID=UPI003C411E33
MEKRMILAIAMSLAVLIGYQYFFSAPPLPPGKTAGKDNAAAVPAPAATGGSAPAPASVIGGLAAKTAASARTITVKTPLYSASIATEGGAVSSFLLNGYKDIPGPGGKPLDIVGGKKVLELSLYLDEDRPPLPSPPVFASDAPAEIAVKAGENRSVVLTWESTAGVRVTREYVFHGDKYEFEARVQTSNGSKEAVAARPGLELDQVYEGELAGDSYSFHGIVVDPGKGGLKRYDLKDISKGKVEKGPARWFAADAKYFTWIVLPEREWTVVRASLAGETGARVAAADTAATLQ